MSSTLGVASASFNSGGGRPPILAPRLRSAFKTNSSASQTWLVASEAGASVAYGSINNFDTVNDTGVPCHGFEIELDDIHSKDITYTYDWNHYGTPRITEDNADPLHPKVFVRYESAKTNGLWAAFTAVPAGPIAPTQGHQFTDPSVNFGGEHFGVGYGAAPTVVRYNWLIDDGFGNLIHGGAVNVATPTFTYVPPAAGVPAQVQAAIVPPPPPPELPPVEFGEPTWVKEIRTTTHNNNELKLRDLVGHDPDFPGEKDWRNGEPDEVETEWQLLQTDFNSANGGANGELKGAPEGLANGDEIISRRYEFYKYVGPLDPETGEARASKVGPDGIHGDGKYADTIVVGDFFGAQMSAFDAELPIGMIDHLPDGEFGTMYPTRTVIIANGAQFTTATSGSLPDGMTFDSQTGEVSGTPMTSGNFIFNIVVLENDIPVSTKAYAFSIADAGIELPPHSSVDTAAFPIPAGTTTGTGIYSPGEIATVTARPNPTFEFSNWTDNSTVVSTNSTYAFTVHIHQSLVANFIPSASPLLTIETTNDALLLSWPTNFTGFHLEGKETLPASDWTPLTNAITPIGSFHQVRVIPQDGTLYFRLLHP